MFTFKQAFKDSERYTKRHLLLGNGFSIACRPDIFVYGKLFERADFSALSPSARHAFEALGTQDFEKVIKALRDASALVALYEDVHGDVPAQMVEDAEGLREVLVQAIASSHPEWPGELTDVEYAVCRVFLNNFDTVYTLNYDLLLYWVQMHTQPGVNPSSDDGFRKPEDDLEANYVTWEPENSYGQNTWFLHGALHIFDTGTELQKYTWVNTGIRLIEQIRDALERSYFPLFVAEGTSEEKLERIRHNDYLAKAYRSFSSIGGALFIYGHSLAENDEHYLKRIEKGKIRHVYVGIYGDPTSAANKAIISRAKALALARKGKTTLDVSFFDAGTTQVWES
ncbi:DUF4917 family protein [Desulfuromonas acetoxidans]|uniref:DUF4917 domain-containing protein n=1 Tax=Desulfuromonas acetoxidans (strain DSM 684 / 11070) TaxID=281689 RepID=Q1JWY7_DESA6|nr:DUF4917 family protein [Desulfuromonas acetoxidans]EAT14771.1 conserved hypothetical protein [Desulfuromonas acetoxidans DSM 684]MBF0645845.1 DUF4917 family protein [Desulfuromonas acetoxidans]NVD25025.1 DUF4917 family protein [Desulfuromonas acetoxidans]NVE17070.1 DUF4917 family protein [Desulfuromonas acetoxidans]